MTKEEAFKFIDDKPPTLKNRAALKDIIEDLTKQEAIGFKNWIIKLPPNKLCSVWPPAGSGSGTGLYLKEDSVLWDEYQKEKL